MARFQNGWVKAWRKAAEGDLPGNVYLWGVWHWLLYSATWKPTSILWKGKRRDIPAGTVVFSPRELSDRWECSRKTIQRWLDYLHESGRIVLETSSRGTIVTLVNWDLYQGDDEEDVQPSRSEVAAKSQQGRNEVALIEEGKKERREERRNIHAFDFEAIYRKYPRKEGKDAGLRQCGKQIRTEEDYQALSLAVDRYAAHCKRTDQIVKIFSSFLGSERTGYPWRDWLDADAGSGVKTGGDQVDFLSAIQGGGAA